MKNYNINNISVIGGGNIGTQFACVCAYKGYNVTVYSSKPEKYNGKLTIVDSENNITCQGTIKEVTNSIERAMKADLVFLAYPAFMFSTIGKMIEPYIRPGILICSLPGTGGVEFAFNCCLKKGAILSGLQRVPAVARLVEYGRIVQVEGKRESLYLASIPNKYSKQLCEFMCDLFDMPCYSLPNYLSVTMTPSNPILHTARLSTLFADYKTGNTYVANPRFYGDWTDDASIRLLKCDEEHQNMLKKITKMDLSAVKSLVIHYDNSDTPEKMTKKIRSIKSLQNLLSPMIQTPKGYIPDFNSRYFTADFPYGLAIIEEFGDIVNAEMPTVKETMQWYKTITGEKDKFRLCDNGIRNIQDIYDFYS